jgi:2-succinyl-6-hydroxy-2,4-cyclohexadiene-1-carboxylate synthase
MMTMIRVNRVGLNYEEAGKGEAVVFLHGFTGSHQDWRNQIARIKGDYRCLALDFRGHGESEAPKQEQDYSIYHNVEDVYQLLNQLGIDRCCLVGHSMGGFTALQFILDHPEKVAGLVLVDTSSGEWDADPGAAELRAKLTELALSDGLEAAFAYDAANNPVRIERYQKYPEMKEITRRKMLQTSVEGYVHVPKSFGTWNSVTHRLAEIKVPAIIIRGEEDAAFIRASQILKDAIKGAELVVVPGAFHNPHEESPEFFNDIFTKFFNKVKWHGI